MRAGFSLKPRSLLRVVMHQHLRLDDNLRRLDTAISEVGVGIAPAAVFQIMAGYRAQFERNPEGDYSPRFRVQLDTIAGKTFRAIALGYRLRLQAVLDPGGEVTDYGVRNRISLALRPRATWSPGASAELFLQKLGADSIQVERQRVTVFSRWVTCTGTYELFYRVEVPVSDDGEPTRHIAGIDYLRVIDSTQPD